ncbi:hypothetical protein ASG01_08790 [Chryseobacterium sp. Leaf180]|uniref:hypothetical protein n=1 Tax=Chryseobacterium sp. Leaf180 TaxID=1736289 RepID=UPI0006FA678F|nr:hypothetical protein [Chryseobacterium sp. Leaf180]KQR93284.1 hypothetical protein ASG01_08790 [Chryseobacterium sp. Leaf180]
MKALLIILSFLVVCGCKTKKVLKSTATETEIVQISAEKTEEKQVEQSTQKQEEKKRDQVDQKKESQTDIEIKGKAETDKPLEVYNIENGDTLQAIKITGNADVSIRAKTSKSEQIKKENNISVFTNKVEEFARNIVKEENLKKTGKEIKKSAKEVTTRTGTFWSFGLIGGLGAVALVLIALLIYFKRK